MSPEEFTEIYREHQGLVRSVIFQITGREHLDDIVQEAFIRIWKNFGSFRNDSKLSSWIYRISVNTALDHVRSRNRRDETSSDEIEQKEANAPGPEREVSGRDLVTKGLMHLSEEHRTVIVLALMQGLSIAEVCEVLEVSEGTVKSRLHYAKAEFRDFLARNGVEL